MKKYIGFGVALTLLELIIAIGLCAFFAAMDLRIFAAARRLENESDRLSHAVIAAQNAAEFYKAGEDPDLYYGGDWLPTDKESAEYIVTVETSVDDEIETASISVSDINGELFALTAKASTEALP
ncbi:MAG: hypothetical protein QMB62_09475 [Oscillospiraceae bacterium]